MLAARSYYQRHSADVLMTGMVLIWGFHFIVIKDAVSAIPPLTFNALRFMVGLPLIGLTAFPNRRLMRIGWRDLALITGLTIVGPLGYQVGFVLGIDRTTSTNSALLVATLPAWTALFSLLGGIVEVRRRLLTGLVITLAGVGLVVVGRGGEGVGLSHDDLVGSALLLGAAMASGFSNVFSQDVIDRLGGTTVAIWKYLIATAGLILLAGGDLFHLSSDTIPLRSVPNILYSAMTGVSGFVIVHYALKRIGATRTSSYFNFNPIVAAIAAILILGEPFSLVLLAGGTLTLAGVLMVRRNIYLRRRPEPPAAPASLEPPPAPP